ncbi:MAG: NmrA/HSCARG family protein [bacterium]
MSQRSVLVTGATGNQGRAVTEALLEKGHRVRALVRNPEEGAAKITDDRVEVAVGDFDEPETLRRAASGMDAVFAMTTPFAGVDVEVRHGKAIADAAKAAGVGHLVYSSVSDADRKTGIPHFDSKYEVEQYVRGLGVPWTITAPVFFYDNVLFPWNLADLKEGRFRQALKASRKLQQISLRDIGRFNALVIDRKEPFIGMRINIAGDELTVPKMAEALTKAIGRNIAYEEQPMEEVRAQFADMAAMYEWFDRVGFSADLEALRQSYPEFGWISYQQWAGAQDWSPVVT